MAERTSWLLERVRFRRSIEPIRFGCRNRGRLVGGGILRGWVSGNRRVSRPTAWFLR